MAKIVTLNGRDWEILDGVDTGPPNVGGRPPRSNEHEAILLEAALNIEVTPNAAATLIRKDYFAGAKVTDEQVRRQVKYLAKIIRNRRRGFVPLD